MPETSVYTVTGIIYDEHDSPSPNVTVKLFDKDLRTETLLGEKASDAKGSYQLSFNADAPANPEHKTADLLIKLFNVRGQLLGQSRVYFNVGENTTIDFKIGNTAYKGTNEFDVLLQKIKPIIEPHQVLLGQLQENEQYHDISFLAGETGEDAEQISFINAAFALSKQTGIEAAIFYGLFRMGFPIELDALLLIKADSTRKAVIQAIDENIISSKWNTGLDKVIIKLNGFAVKNVIDGEGSEAIKFKKLMGSALSTDQQKVFAETYYAYETEPEKFWEQLKQKPGFTDGKAIEKTKQVLRLNLVTANQLELTNKLLKAQETDVELKDIRGFAKYTQADWKRQITEAGVVNFPEWVSGTTPVEKSDNYAASLEQLHKQLYPTTFFAQRLKKDAQSSFALKPNLDIFFTKNPDFDLQTNSIHKQFEQSNFESIQDKEGLKKELKTLNRLYKLTDNYSEVNALHSKQLFSATDIASKYGEVQFKKEFAAVLGNAESAGNVYQNAVSVSNKVTAWITGIKMRYDIMLYAIDGNNEAPEGYHEMFGDGELCECEHCQSMYSPAAYFVDMLAFIKGKNEEAYYKLVGRQREPGIEPIKGRRMDLDDIKLTCKNTNTPLPYIDLVNELLEKQVEALSTTEDDAALAILNQSYQTESVAAELVAMPEHISNAAYGNLKNANGDAVFSPILPFDQPLEEIRIYTEKLGWNRLELMESFYGNKVPRKLNDSAVAAELLNFSKAELAIISGTPPLTISLPNSNKIDAFLNKTKLSYIELLQLLETYFLNPDRALSIEQEAVEGEEEQLLTCNLNKLFINGATDAWLNKLVRFVRLWKKRGWNIFDLDRAMIALGLTDFPATEAEFIDKLLLPLSHIQRIQQQLNLPLIEVLTLFANVDTTNYTDHSKEGQPIVTSLYQQMFLNRAVTDPINDAFKNSETLTGPLAPHQETLIAAFGISMPNLILLMKEGDQLSLNTLSRLYRFALLSRALKTTVQELLKVISIAGNTLADGKWTTKLLLEFLEDWNLFKSSGIATDSYQLLLSTKVGAGYKLPVDGNLITVFTDHLNNLQVIKTIANAHEQKTQLSARVELIVQSLTGINTVLQDITVKLIHPDDLVLKANIEGYLGEENKETLLSLTPDELISRVTVLKSSFEEYRFWKSTPVIFKTLGFDLKKIHWLEANKLQTGTGLLWNETIDFANPDVYTAFKKLLHLSKLNKVKTGNDLSWTDLLNKVIKNEANAKAESLDLLTKLYRVSESNLNFLAGPKDDINNKGELNLTFPDDFKGAQVILNLLSCCSLMDKLGATGNQVQALTSANTTPENAQAAKNLLKSRYSNTNWLAIIKPINDGFRTRRRDALLAWLLANAGATSWKKTNDIYEALLIDVEMESCMVTSRIKQAISSVQLFINRCLMNLEAGIQLDDKFATQWHQWRKQYRVWEANRKVFLYPENWIEPDLRDGKSPFFKDLESQLKQNEVTEETAKEALLAYLEKLDKVANLEMVGLFNDEETKIVHAFGRTHNIPHLYYYRTLENSVWSAWEKVEVDIEGDHILPVVWNGRLMLFWAQFTEKQVEGSSTTSITGDPGNMSMSSPPPATYLEIKLAWSEYKKGKWGGKKVSKQVISTLNFNLGSHMLKEFHISLTTNILEENLIVTLYNPYRTDYAQEIAELVLRLGAFVFDGCNNSPYILYFEPTEEFWNVLQRIKKVDHMQMWIKENNQQDKFSLFETGFYKTLSANADEKIIFTNTPKKFQVIPNHHEIEKDKPVLFFYNNKVNNFYVHSKERVRPVTGDFSLDNVGVLMTRKTVSPVSKTASIKTSLTVTTLQRRSNFFRDTINPDLLDGVNVIREPYRILFGKKYLFQTFYHPYICEYIKKLNTNGFEALYTADSQNKDPKILFTTIAYNPTERVLSPYPKEEVDFSYTGSYALYNWELFFHIPLLIATRLSQNQKFEEAQKWFHFIFDPTKSSSAGNLERFWITQPFKKEIQEGIVSIEQLLLSDKYAEELGIQLENWERKPFNPHAVARLRVSSYMRNTILRYIDNLVAWGDQLFRRDTIESINEATLLYILASNILGEKQEVVPPRAKPVELSFAQIEEKGLNQFSNVKAEIESFISPSSGDDTIRMPYFCLPKNDNLLKYWDIVADRLFKIRHCQNIEGVFRQLPLFEPPIDPALLVRATAAGLDLNTILNDVNTSLPDYRFQVMLQQANEICDDVKMLGGSLLSALEKKDTEEIALLRSGHELKMLEMIRDIKEKQRDEAKEVLNNVMASQTIVEARRDYYLNSPYTNSSEAEYFSRTNLASQIEQVTALNSTLASFIYLIPTFKFGPFSFGVEGGGPTLGNAAMAGVKASESGTHLMRLYGEMANVKGNYDRREEDRKYQVKIAELELKQIDKQIIAAEIRLAIAEKDIENHDLQTEHSQEVDDYMRSKFTNAELYNWMLGQLSTIYFQTYQLAYATAKKAEKCLQYELGLESTNYIQFGYWDNLKSGLLSGEKLQYDLRMLENAYLEKNTRAFEITKHLSLVSTNPLALLQLRETGKCDITLPEELFDMDFPGHYFRRVKSMSLSIPCIAGPYTSVNATLRLTRNMYRIDKTAANVADYKISQAELETPGSGRFRSGSNSVSAIATSSAQNDSGVFELNFRDERYLPFEGSGVASKWSLELMEDAALRQFDYKTISDVIFHLKYTAQEGGSAFKTAATDNLKEVIINATGNGRILSVLFDARHEYSNEWHRFISSEGTDNSTNLVVSISKDRLPFFAANKNVEATDVILFAKKKDGGNFNTAPSNTNPFTLEEAINFGDSIKLFKAILGDTPINITEENDFVYTLTMEKTDVEKLEEMYILLRYKLS